MKNLLLTFVPFVLFAICGCSKFAGDPVTETFDINGSYTELQVESAFDVTVSDEVNQLTVTAGEFVMPKVVVEKKGDRLIIKLKPLSNYSVGDLKVLLPYNADLNVVDLSGASEFRSEFGLKGHRVEVDLSGASDFYADLEADEIDLDLSGASSILGRLAAGKAVIDLSGASDATLEGLIDKLRISLSGSSNLVRNVTENKYSLSCIQCEGSISGASDAYIHCDGSISVSVSGASGLHYTGNAATSGSHTTGGSSVKHDVL